MTMTRLTNMQRASLELKAAHDELRDAHVQGARLIVAERNGESVDDGVARRQLQMLRAAVAEMRQACDRWQAAFAMAQCELPPLRVGTLALVHRDGVNLLSRTAAPPFVADNGEWLVALEGIEGHAIVPMILPIDDVRCFVGEDARTTEPLTPTEIGEAGCPGCVRLGGGLAMLQEQVARMLDRVQAGGSDAH